MPIYEYEPDDRECLMCDGKVSVIQGIHDEPLRYCPDCGLEVCRVISQASFQLRKGASPGKAGERGFTTWKRSERGVWEKLAGPGADYLIGSPEDMKATESQKAPKRLELDP